MKVSLTNVVILALLICLGRYADKDGSDTVTMMCMFGSVAIGICLIIEGIGSLM